METQSDTTPGQDYRVELEAYAGPLDLLLYLVKRHEIDLDDIPIAELTDRYLRHLEVIREIDIERAGEFLVMASTLLEIKSAMLSLQQQDDDQEMEAAEVDEIDPRHELVQQLLAYKQYKDAAHDLEDRREAWSRRFPVQVAEPEAPEPDENAPLREIDLEDVNVLDLCEAFSRILDSVGQRREGHDVVYDDTPIALHAADIEDRLRREGAMTLQAIFVGRSSRSEMIGLFLATLELVRQRKVRAFQSEPEGEIRLEVRQEAPGEEEETDERAWRDPDTGEVAYDWPTEEARERYERRQARQARRAAAADGEDDEAEEADEGEDDEAEEADEETGGAGGGEEE